MPKKIRNSALPATPARHTRPRVSLASRSVLPARTTALPHDPIFHEDGEEDASVPTISHRLRARPKPQPPASSQPVVKLEEDQFIPDYSRDSDFQVERRRKAEGPILFSSSFPQVSEIDFKIFADSAARTRVFSVMLVDNYGRIIFSDKLGHELFEGSLNNFATIRIQNLLLRTLKDSFLAQLRDIQDFNERTTVNWIIYSKNTKRRYSRVPFSCTNAQDTYYRFLKALTLRIRPIKINFSECASIDGFWNPTIKTPVERDLYLLEARLCSRMPPLTLSVMLNDALLAKYIKSNAKKAHEWALEVAAITVQFQDQMNPPLLEANDDYGASSVESSHSFSHVSFSEPEVGECKIEEQMSEEAEVEVKVEAKREVKEEAKAKREGRGVGLFAQISIDDV